MGDRANLRLRYSGDKELILYTHWGGRGLYHLAQNAMRNVIEAGCIGDEERTAMVVIHSLTSGLPVDWRIGFAYAADAEYPLIEINMVDARVQVYQFNKDRHNWTDDVPIYEESPCWSGTAQEYAALGHDVRRFPSVEHQEAAEA